MIAGTHSSWDLCRPARIAAAGGWRKRIKGRATRHKDPHSNRQLIFSHKAFRLSYQYDRRRRHPHCQRPLRRKLSHHQQVDHSRRRCPLRDHAGRHLVGLPIDPRQLDRRARVEQHLQLRRLHRRSGREHGLQRRVRTRMYVLIYFFPAFVGAHRDDQALSTLRTPTGSKAPSRRPSRSCWAALTLPKEK